MPARRSLLLAVPVLAVMSAAAHAECKFSPFAFFPDRNDAVVVHVTTDAASYCDNSFREGPGYAFTKVSVVKAPPHGIIATLGPNHFAYRPFPNYRGRDAYTIRACANVGPRKGCSTLHYAVTVQ